METASCAANPPVEFGDLHHCRSLANKLQVIGSLTSGIAHDFNNLLNAILGFSELAHSKADPGTPQREYLDQVIQAAERAQLLVDQILQFGRGGTAGRAVVDVQAIVAEALGFLRLPPQPKILVESRLDCGGSAIPGDPTQVHQVVMNLCTNAVHAMPAGGVLSVRLERERVHRQRPLLRGTVCAGDYVRLEVRDVGTGIPAAVLDRIFDPFFTTKGIGRGTGLGLSLVASIVAELHGAIDVVTAHGQGTTFKVWLPRCADLEAAQPPSVHERAELVLQ